MDDIADEDKKTNEFQATSIAQWVECLNMKSNQEMYNAKEAINVNMESGGTGDVGAIGIMDLGLSGDRIQGGTSVA